MKFFKTSAQKCGCWSAIFTLSAFTAAADIQVTYNVDMSVQEQLGNFNPANGDTVFVSGNFATTNGVWLQTATDGSTNYILTLVPGTTNYTGTFTITNGVGTEENHQFVINPGGNFAGTLIWEPNVIGGPNRYFPVPAVNTNLPLVFFNDVSNANQLVTIPVTFSVDMSVQSALGNFDEANDIVLVSGDFNGFTANSATVMTDNGANVWSATFDVTNSIGATENYKFLFLPFSGNPSSVWEVDGVGPNGANNRQFVLPDTATNLPIAYFNNLTNANSLVSIPVTFQVNLGVKDALGTFTPGVDTVTVSGDISLNDWSATSYPLTNTVANPDLYTGTYNVANTVGATTSYKFVVDGGSGLGWEANNVGPGGAQNRQLVVPNSATNLPMVYWNNIGDLGKLSVSNNAGNAVLKWTAGTRVRLQSSTSLTSGSGWQDVPNTQGSNSASININGKQFFRLTGP